MIKRGFDLCLSGIALIFMLPFFIIIGIAIKLNSDGPIFFRQIRVGRFQKLFRIHKFRTMIACSDLNGPLVTTAIDGRITSIGKLLRKYKIDELPQLIDVFIGSMSLVGPRPEVPEYVNLYPDSMKEIIFSVRPGITDLASIEFRNENELLALSKEPLKTYINEILPIKLLFCAEYVRKHSFLLDLKIIIKTVYVIIFKNN